MYLFKIEALSRSRKRALILFQFLLLLIFLVVQWSPYVMSSNYVYVPTKRAVEEKPSFQSWKNKKGKPKEAMAYRIPEHVININQFDQEDFFGLGLNRGQCKAITNRLDLFGPFLSEEEFLELPYLEKAWKEQNCHLLYCENYEEEIRDINRMDSIEWVSIKGIGPVLSARILDYRELLGGFIHSTQLYEVYGVSDSLYAEFKVNWVVDTSLIEKMNVRQDSFSDLLKHPYFSLEQLKELFDFQNKMEMCLPFNEWIQLNSFSEQDLSRLKPYIQDE